VHYTSIRSRARQRRDLLLVVAAVIAGWALARIDVDRKLVVTRALRSTVLAPFIAVHQAVLARSDLVERLAELQAEADTLARIVASSAALSRENDALRGILALRDRASGDFLVAEIVPGSPAIGDSHRFLVRGGSSTGIRPPVGVGVAAGLVGIIRTATPGTAIGDFWTDPEFRVSARTEDGSASGIVRATTLSSGEEMMLLEWVPFQTRIASGTPLVTTGIGGLYPEAMRIGIVRAEAAAKSGWSKSYLVEPSVRPAGTRIVLVWRRPPPDGTDSESPRE